MRRVYLTASFVIIGLFCVFSLGLDLMGLIELDTKEFLAIAIFGITNAFVYSELVFNGKRESQDEHKNDPL